MKSYLIYSFNYCVDDMMFAASCESIDIVLDAFISYDIKIHFTVERPIEMSISMIQIS